MSSSQSKKTVVNLSDEAERAFCKIKTILASEDVLLLHSDYITPFELTTDASSSAMGAVLSQNGKPITMISRTLSRAEDNYATNEREMLAIVWALQKLRNYFYGAKNINIYTDHQPLSFSISEKNPNPKMRRWRAFIEEYSPNFFYKSGKDNVVADALSRQYINHVEDKSEDNALIEATIGSESISLENQTSPQLASEESKSVDSTIHSEESLSEVIKTVSNPVNYFRNQILLYKSAEPSMSSQIIFKNSSVVNCLHCDIHILGTIQNKIIKYFPSAKFVYSEKFVIDIHNQDDQNEITVSEHNRAHRSVRENLNQILRNYYFPNIRNILKAIVSNCRICNE